MTNWDPVLITWHQPVTPSWFLLSSAQRALTFDSPQGQSIPVGVQESSREVSAASQPKGPRAEAMKKQQGQCHHLSYPPLSAHLGRGVGDLEDCWLSYHFGRLSGLWVNLTPSRRFSKLPYGWFGSLSSRTSLFRTLWEASSGLSTKDCCLKRWIHSDQIWMFPGVVCALEIFEFMGFLLWQLSVTHSHGVLPCTIVWYIQPKNLVISVQICWALCFTV